MDPKQTKKFSQNPQFNVTDPSPCPYIEGKMERKTFTELIGKNASTMNSILTQIGFRRSQYFAYRPFCEQCNACISVRVKVNEFELSKNMRRVKMLNQDIVGRIKKPYFTDEQYSVFRSYVDNRHLSGGMSEMGIYEFATMIEETSVDSRVIEYRQNNSSSSKPNNHATPLIGVALTDLLEDGISMVYTFYDIKFLSRSLGTYMILDHIARVKRAKLPYLYLGYWVKNSPKMDYKIRFQPQEHLGPNGWQLYSP